MLNAEILDNILLSFNLFICVYSCRVLNIRCWRYVDVASGNVVQLVYFVATLRL